jgi:hypothetical protein
MMNIIIIALIAIVVVLRAVIAMQPSTFRVTRTATDRCSRLRGLCAGERSAQMAGMVSLGAMKQSYEGPPA